MPDMSSAWGIPLIIPMSEYWPTTPDNVGRSLSGNLFVRPQILSLLQQYPNVDQLPLVLQERADGRCLEREV
jgi:hypothetical protein